MLKEPEEMILTGVGVVPGTDGQKMSKSYGNTIPLFGTTKEIEKAVMSIVTDSTGDRPEHVYAIHRLIKSEEDLAPLYEQHKGRYGDLKKSVKKLENIISPMRERRAAISDEDVKEVLAEGALKARELSSKTLTHVRSTVRINI